MDAPLRGPGPGRRPGYSWSRRARDDLDWAAITAGDVTRLVVQQCSARSRSSACKLISELRSFLSFASLDGRVRTGS